MQLFHLNLPEFRLRSSYLFGPSSSLPLPGSLSTLWCPRALELPVLAGLPVAVLVPVWAFEAVESAWLPVDVVVFACAFDPPDDVVAADAVPLGLDRAVDGELVVDVLVVCNVEEPPVDLVAAESLLSGLDDQ